MRDHIAREPADDRVAALLAAAAAPAERPVPGEAEALAAFRLAMGSPPGPLRRRMQTRTTAKLTAVTALSAVSILGGSLAAASTGALPGAAQQTARDALARVGVTVPGPADHGAEASATRGKSAEAKAAAAARKAEATVAASPEVTATTAPNAHGKAVSELARTTTLTGAEKGAAVCTLASGGKCKAGERKEAAAEAEATPTPATTEETSEPTEETSQPSENGRKKADDAGGGRSGAGSAATETPQP